MSPGLKQVISNVSFPAGRDLLKLPWVAVQRPTEESLCEVVLSPGDVLYLPKGCWHRAQAIGHSLGLTLAMESVSLLELIQTGLQPGLNTVTFRDALPGYASADLAEGMPRELEEIFGSGLEALRRLIDDVSPANLYAAWTQTEAQAQSMRLRADKSSATSPGRVNSTQIS